jgi:S1-C subfamily serine protease
LVSYGYSQIDQKLFSSIVSLRQEVTVETIKNPVFDKEDILISGSITDKKVDIISRGSGTIISSGGLIMTNYHVWNYDVRVVKDAQKKYAYRYSPTMDDMFVFVLDPNNIFKEPRKKYLARYLSGDKNKDVVILKCYYDVETGQKIQNLNLNYMPLGNPFGIEMNSKITIAGYPSIGGSTITVTEGKFLGYYSDQNCTIKTDAAISYGNSGGAAVFYNKLFGIPTAVSTQTGGANFGYINPVTRNWADCQGQNEI